MSKYMYYFRNFNGKKIKTQKIWVVGPVDTDLNNLLLRNLRKKQETTKTEHFINCFEYDSESVLFFFLLWKTNKVLYHPCVWRISWFSWHSPRNACQTWEQWGLHHHRLSFRRHPSSHPHFSRHLLPKTSKVQNHTILTKPHITFNDLINKTQAWNWE